MNPKVLFVDHTAALGGAELFLLSMAERLGPEHEVLLFEDGPFRRRLEARDVPVDVLPAPAAIQTVTRDAGLRRDLRAIPGVVRHAWRLAQQAGDADVLFANSQKSMIVAGLAGAFAQRPVLWYLHDMLTRDHFSQLHCRVAAGLGSVLPSRVVANSSASRRAFVQQGGTRERSYVVHNGIDPAPYEEADASEAAAIRSELGLGDAPVVGTFSRIAPWKGQHVALSALRELPDVHALFVGEPLFESDRDYAARIRKRAASWDLEDRVHWLGFRDDVPRLMKLCDIVLHTSTAPEPFGRVVVEGMLARRPVIAARAGGAEEIVDHGTTGLLTEPGDAAALTRAIQKTLRRPEWAAGLAQRGYEMATRRFSIAAAAEALRRHLRETARGAAGAREPEPSLVP